MSATETKLDVKTNLDNPWDCLPQLEIEEGSSPTDIKVDLLYSFDRNAALKEGLKVWIFLLIATCLSIVLVGSLWITWFFLEGPQEQLSHSSAFGWAAVACAALCFSFTEVPLKVPGSQEVGALLFNAYGFLGGGLINCLALPVLLSQGYAFRLQPHGCLGALNLLVVQYIARHAVWRIGIGAAPTCWAAVGMLVSFFWGTVVFGDRPWNLPIALLGIVLILFGVSLVSLALYLSSKGATTTSSGGQDSSWRNMALGLGLSVLTGVCDGSMVTFFVAFETQASDGRSFESILQYFASFGLSLLAIGVIVFFGHWLLGPGRKMRWQDYRPRESGVPGMLSGVLWALANTCSILGAYHMGMALAFPLTQTCAILSGIWALTIFRELKTRLAVVVFAVSMLIAVGGALLLSLFGCPIKPWP